MSDPDGDRRGAGAGMPAGTGRTPMWALRNARRVVVAVVGATIVALGALMLLLPGPGLLTIFVGLTVLAAEFAWARRLLRRAKQMAGSAAERVTGTGRRVGPDA